MELKMLKCTRMSSQLGLRPVPHLDSTAFPRSLNFEEKDKKAKKRKKVR